MFKVCLNLNLIGQITSFWPMAFSGCLTGQSIMEMCVHVCLLGHSAKECSHDTKSESYLVSVRLGPKMTMKGTLARADFAVSIFFQSTF